MHIKNVSIGQVLSHPLSLLRSRTFIAALSVGILLAGEANASTGGFGVIRAALGTPGVVDQKVLHYSLVRNDLTAVTLRGTPITSAALAGGYLAFEQLSRPNTFFFAGSLPVKPAELPAVEKALSAANLPVTVVANAAVRASVNVLLVHIEGTATETDLAAGLSAVLALIGNPQLGVTEVEIPSSSVIMPSEMIPMKDIKLLNKGVFSMINTETIVFSLPRADAAQTNLGPVTASESLGVGQRISLSGNGTAAIVAELALRSDEVQGVTAALLEGGFTISTQSDYFVDDSDRLTFIRAEAVAKSPDENKVLARFESEGAALMKALLLIRKHNS